MVDVVLTGASRGIGRALALRLSAQDRATRIFAIGRSGAALESLAVEAARRCEIIPRTIDLSRLESVRAAGPALAEEIAPSTTLIHNAGVWPSRRVLTGGLEAAFVTNCLSPLVLQAPLLASGRVTRVLVVGAGLMVKGRFSREKTPTGADFSSIFTYATTKLAGAVMMRVAARAHPEVDLVVVHPGVVATDLGDRPGLLGALLRLAKRRFEPADRCAERLARILDLPRWERTAGVAPWYFEEREQPWPEIATQVEAEVRAAVEPLLREHRDQPTT